MSVDDLSLPDDIDLLKSMARAMAQKTGKREAEAVQGQMGYSVCAPMPALVFGRRCIPVKLHRRFDAWLKTIDIP